MAVAGDDHANRALGQRLPRQSQRLRQLSGRFAMRGVLFAEQLFVAPATARGLFGEESLVERVVKPAHLGQRELLAHPPSGAFPHLVAASFVPQQGDDRVGVTIDIIAWLDQDAAVDVHELDVAGQSRGDHRHAHRQRLVDDEGNALVDTGHQQQVGAAVPAGHVLRRRVPFDQLGDAQLLSASLGRLPEVTVADDIEHELRPALPRPRQHLHRQQRVLLLDQATRPEDPLDAVARQSERLDPAGVELAFAVDSEVDHLDPARRDLVVDDRLLEVLADDREGIDQVAVAPGHVAHVAGLVRFLGMKLHDDRRAAPAGRSCRAAGRSRAASS